MEIDQPPSNHEIRLAVIVAQAVDVRLPEMLAGCKSRLAFSPLTLDDVSSVLCRARQALFGFQDGSLQDGRVIFRSAAIVLSASVRGNVMSKRLSADDRHAVDLILERPNGQGDLSLVEMMFAHPVQGQFEERLDKVEELLGVLDLMPALEPSDDLVSRTMQRIEESQLEPRATETPEQRLSRDSQRHA